eukprot:568691-Prymnesium_polylepis.1
MTPIWSSRSTRSRRRVPPLHHHPTTTHPRPLAATRRASPPRLRFCAPQALPLRVLTDMQGGVRRVPFATIVTDLGSAHPTWFHSGVDACFVPSDAVVRCAKAKGVRAPSLPPVRRQAGARVQSATVPCSPRKRTCAHAPPLPPREARAGSCQLPETCRHPARVSVGLKPKQLRKHGLPVRPAFWEAAPPRGRLLRELGLSDGRKTVLIVGGGDGVGSLKTIVEATASTLSKECPDGAQVCGRRQRAAHAVCACAGACASARAPLHLRVRLSAYACASALAPAPAPLRLRLCACACAGCSLASAAHERCARRRSWRSAARMPRCSRSWRRSSGATCAASPRTFGGRA